MFFDFGAGEILGLAILGMMLVGPERLPKLAAEAAQWVKKLRGLASTATSELRENLGPGYEDLTVADLNPKKFISKHLNEAIAEPAAEIAEIKKMAKIDPDLL